MNGNGQINRSEAVEVALKRLASAEHFIGASLIAMPSLYPSGSCVVLQISGGGRGFDISDRGGAYGEAEGMGGLRGFKTEAEKLINDTLLRFDGREFSVSGVQPEHLASAMQLVSHNSQLAANLIAMRVADRIREVASDQLFEKLVSIFSAKRVTRDAPFMGASNHEWKFDALVTKDDKRVVFEAVSPSQGSVVWAATKFADLARLEQDVGRVAVVESREAMGDMMGVMSPNVTSILERRAPNQDYAAA